LTELKAQTYVDVDNNFSFFLTDSVTSFVHLRGADNSDDADDDDNTDGDGDDDDHFSAFS